MPGHNPSAIAFLQEIKGLTLSQLYNGDFGLYILFTTYSFR